MENFEKYFNEDFDLHEAIEFKDVEKKKEFNRSWVIQFKDILLNTSLRHCDKAKPAGGGWSYSCSSYKVENIFVGAKTGNLIVQTVDGRNTVKQFSIDALRNSFNLNGTKKEHWELDTSESTEKLLALLGDYNTEYDLAAKDANYVSRSENAASENIDKKITVGKELAAGKKQTLEDWVRTNITNIVFKIPSTERATDAPKSLSVRLDKTASELEKRYPGITKSSHFEIVDKNAESVRSWYGYWGIIGLVTFAVPYEKFPKDLRQLVDDCKQKSKDKDRNSADAKDTDYTINNIYFAFAILDILDGDYTVCDKNNPAAVANSNDVFKQDFDSINAYGEKVESLKEAKEEICCICGEPIEGYGNNPSPYKHEGRCCDACNLKFVIPARLAELSSSDEDL